MQKRKSIPRGKSKKLFKKTAGSNGVHPKNFQSARAAMRGGIRF